MSTDAGGGTEGAACGTTIGCLVPHAASSSTSASPGMALTFIYERYGAGGRIPPGVPCGYDFVRTSKERPRFVLDARAAALGRRKTLSGEWEKGLSDEE